MEKKDFVEALKLLGTLRVLGPSALSAEEKLLVAKLQKELHKLRSRLL